MIITIGSFTKGGSFDLARFYRDKLSCKIVREPYYDEETTKWFVDLDFSTFKISKNKN